MLNSIKSQDQSLIGWQVDSCRISTDEANFYLLHRHAILKVKLREKANTNSGAYGSDYTRWRKVLYAKKRQKGTSKHAKIPKSPSISSFSGHSSRRNSFNSETTDLSDVVAAVTDSRLNPDTANVDLFVTDPTATSAQAYSFSGMGNIFYEHKMAVTRIKFANGNKDLLAFGSLDGTITVVNALDGKVVANLIGHSKGVTDIDWSITNDFIISTSLDKTVRQWNALNGECKNYINDEAELNCCTFHPITASLYAVGTARGEIKIYNLNTGKQACKAKIETSIKAICFATHGNFLYAGDNKGYVHSFEYKEKKNKLKRTTKTVISAGHPVSSVTYGDWYKRQRTPLLLVNCQDNTVTLCRITETGALTLRRKYAIINTKYNVRGSFCPLICLRDGACIVTGSEDKIVYIFDVTRDTKPCINKLQGHSAPVLDVAWNYDESLLASCDSDGYVILWKREQFHVEAEMKPSDRKGASNEELKTSSTVQ